MPSRYLRLSMHSLPVFAWIVLCGLNSICFAQAPTLRDEARGSIFFIKGVSRSTDSSAQQEFVQATGFVISTSGYLVTSAHVVRPASDGRQDFYIASYGPRSLRQYELELIDVDRDWDVALFRLPEPDPPMNNWQPLQVVSPSRLPAGAQLFVLGFPLGGSLTLGEAILSSRDEPRGRFKTSLPINRGNSGGPVFDATRRVVGVAAGGFDTTSGLTFMVPSHVLKPYCDRVGCAIAEPVAAPTPGQPQNPPPPPPTLKLAQPPPPPPLVPDGKYAGTRGYTEAGRASPTGECLANYDIGSITVKDGKISFESGDKTEIRRVWTGLINQATGFVEIANAGISPRTKTPTSIAGKYDSATLLNGFCGLGFFRMKVPK